jgi:hypothetical protein
MAHRTYRVEGEPDHTILADGGRVFFCEFKTSKGKLSTTQLGIKTWMEKLGHACYVIRSFDEFLKIVS